MGGLPNLPSQRKAHRNSGASFLLCPPLHPSLSSRPLRSGAVSGCAWAQKSGDLALPPAHQVMGLHYACQVPQQSHLGLHVCGPLQQPPPCPSRPPTWERKPRSGKAAATLPRCLVKSEWSRKLGFRWSERVPECAARGPPSVPGESRVKPGELGRRETRGAGTRQRNWSGQVCG